MPALTPFIEQFKNADGSTYNGAAMLASLTGLSQVEIKWTCERMSQLSSVGHREALAIVKAERASKPWLNQSGNATAAFLAIVAFTVIAACAYVTGYTHGQSRCKVEQAKIQTVTETVTKVVTVTDKASVNTLQAKLQAYKAATSTLQAQIEEAAHAHQTTPDAPAGACSLPDSLRDNLNRALATSP